jgi:L-amino acid N-acyltransferase YncA
VEAQPRSRHTPPPVEIALEDVLHPWRSEDAEALNVGSIRVLEKCGYEREGLRRRGACKEGQFVDLVLFARLRPDR